MEQIFYSVRRAVGNCGVNIGKPRQEEQHVSESSAARHRRLQML